MINLVAFALLTAAAYFFQWIEGKLTLGGGQGKVAWGVSLVSIFLAACGGTFLVDPTAGIVEWLTGWGIVAIVALGALGWVGLAIVAFVALPPKFAAAVAGAGALGMAILIPILWPQMIHTGALLWDYMLTGSFHLRELPKRT